MSRLTVVFQPDGRRVTILGEENLLHAAQRCGVGLEDLCGGLGTCAKCKVLVRTGTDLLSPRTDAERRLGGEDHRRGIRLACQTRGREDGSLIVEIPLEAQRGRQRLQTAGAMPSFHLRPEVRRVPARGSARWPRKRSGPPRPASGLESLVVQARKVIGVVPRCQPLWGMAFDIGSTKVAGYLVDLETGETRQTVSAANPQMVHGEDLMSRLAFAGRSPADEALLHREIVETVRALTRRACARAGGPTSRVVAFSAVGNTAMHHFFLGIPVQGLGRAPYRPSTTTEEIRTAQSLGLDGAPEAPVIVPPVVAAFVGSDLVAGVRATRADGARTVRVFVDVGTNTEICAGNGPEIVACSTPSGPAFEGAHIRFGMRASEGAVERVALHPATWVATYRTIGRGKPRGFCGSALLDLLAELARVGAVDSAGRLPRADSHEAVVSWHGQPAFRVVPSSETSIGEDLLLTQEDIGQLQLAKAAIRAGIEILLSELRSPALTVHVFYLAGAFGTYLGPESARRIGMIPSDVPLDRIRFVGNSAGAGARLVLLSKIERHAIRNLARRIRHVSLAGDPRFPSRFAASLSLPRAAVQGGAVHSG